MKIKEKTRKQSKNPPKSVYSGLEFVYETLDSVFPSPLIHFLLDGNFRQHVIIAHNGKICANLFTDGRFANFTDMQVPQSLTIGADGLLYANLTDLNFWNRGLSLREAELYTKDCDGSVNKTNLLIDWNSLLIKARSVENLGTI